LKGDWPRRAAEGNHRKRLPEGPALYPEDYLTDQPERFLAAEIVREKILHHTQQEVPHAVAVMIESWEQTEKLLRIAATIYVKAPRTESDSDRRGRRGR
jgi:GTPase Era involved in 16S rRNA processing